MCHYNLRGITVTRGLVGVSNLNKHCIMNSLVDNKLPFDSFTHSSVAKLIFYCHNDDKVFSVHVVAI